MLLALLLSGCDHDRPMNDPPPGPPQMAQSGPTSDTSVPTSSGASSEGGISGSAAAGGDPLPDTGLHLPSDPLLSKSDDGKAAPDPLLAADPLKGPAMPTQHSHWLRGHVHKAHLTVLLNGARQGSYLNLVDKDITMKLREGLNFVTFIYEPETADASAQMEIVEGEHDPPVPPLTTFNTLSAANGSKPLRQTNMFIAK